MRAPRLDGRLVSQEKLLVELTAMRAFLVPEWCKWLETVHAHADTEANIERVSLYAASFLTKALGPGWFCVGGTPLAINMKTYAMEKSKASGFRSPSGWEPHWWVTCNGWIADITASEIGGAPVLLTSTDDPRYRETFSDNEIALSKKNARERVEAWHTHWLETEAQRVLALRSR